MPPDYTRLLMRSEDEYSVSIYHNVTLALGSAWPIRQMPVIYLQYRPSIFVPLVAHIDPAC
eukprot:scaffold654764_cov59-Prasinocladus_malaysianus.AAC.1